MRAATCQNWARAGLGSQLIQTLLQLNYSGFKLETINFHEDKINIFQKRDISSS